MSNGKHPAPPSTNPYPTVTLKIAQGCVDRPTKRYWVPMFVSGVKPCSLGELWTLKSLEAWTLGTPGTLEPGIPGWNSGTL